jgi:hypothetical protein
MNHLDYNDYVNIRITKVHFDEEPSHWEIDIDYSDGTSLGCGTSPTFGGIWDMAYSIIVGGDKSSDYETNPWSEFDANAKNY